MSNQIGGLSGLTHLAREATRQALGRRAPANPLLFATAGDASGQVAIPDQPGSIYCMLQGDASRTVIALLGTSGVVPGSGSTLAVRVLEPGTLSTYVVESAVVGNYVVNAPAVLLPPVAVPPTALDVQFSFPIPGFPFINVEEAIIYLTQLTQGLQQAASAGWGLGAWSVNSNGWGDDTNGAKF